MRRIIEFFESVTKNFDEKMFVVFSQTFQVYLIANIAIYFGKPYEFIVITLTYLAARSILGVSYHADSFFACSLTSSIIFGSLCYFTPKMTTSIYIQVIFGVFMALLLHMIDVVIILMEENEK